MDSFSKRHNLAIPDAEITIRTELPQEIREVIIGIAYQCGLKPSNLRSYLCNILYRSPDSSNWSEFPNIDYEVRDLISECQWFQVYDLIETLANKQNLIGTSFAEKINECFRIKGVGWQLINNRVEMRGDEVFEEVVRHGIEELHQQGKITSATELHEALNDLSRRPSAEVTGAIQHAMAALECVAREHSGSKQTLGQLVQNTPDLFPKPIDEVVKKAWGYTSNFGRHLTEGAPPSFEEAELMVGISGILCTYLARKLAGNNDDESPSFY